jgi:hypothetical protein
MSVMKRLAGGAIPRIKTGRYGGSGDGFHVDFSMFVDRKGVIERIDRKKLRVLGGTGAYAMGAMRKKIRAPRNTKKSQTINVRGRNYYVPVQGKVRDASTGRVVTEKEAVLAHDAMRQRRQSEGVGQPPRRGPSDLLRKHIFFGVEPESEAVTIGPEMFAKQPPLIGATSVPHLLEKGGAQMIHGVIAKYGPRPYVEPTLPIAQQKMTELIEKIPL